jgi:hypothetical protein
MFIRRVTRDAFLHRRLGRYCWTSALGIPSLIIGSWNRTKGTTALKFVVGEVDTLRGDSYIFRLCAFPSRNDLIRNNAVIIHIKQQPQEYDGDGSDDDDDNDDDDDDGIMAMPTMMKLLLVVSMMRTATPMAKTTTMTMMKITATVMTMMMIMPMSMTITMTTKTMMATMVLPPTTSATVMMALAMTAVIDFDAHFLHHKFIIHFGPRGVATAINCDL